MQLSLSSSASAGIRNKGQKQIKEAADQSSFWERGQEQAVEAGNRDRQLKQVIKAGDEI